MYPLTPICRLRNFGVPLFLLAGAACAFTATDVVIINGAPLYSAGMCGDDAGVVAELAYWTPVAAEAVGNPESPRTYCHVTLKDGREGEMEWLDLGRVHVVDEDGAPVYAAPDEETPVQTRLAEGDWVAEIRVVHEELAGLWLEVVTATGARGWFPAAAVVND